MGCGTATSTPTWPPRRPWHRAWRHPASRGALVFQDAKTDDARLVWRVLLEARRDGANAAQLHGGAKRLQNSQRRSHRRGDQRQPHRPRPHRAGRAVVNATGAWADRLRAGVGAAPLLRPLRGSHLVLPFWRLPVAQSISFMHPRTAARCSSTLGRCDLVGTTDLDHRLDLDVEASITPAEVAYLLDAVNDQFPAAQVTAADISACYAGVRPCH